MICHDCAGAADARATPIGAYHSPSAYIEAAAGHERCKARDDADDRERGQLPRCPCQHRPIERGKPHVRT